MPLGLKWECGKCFETLQQVLPSWALGVSFKRKAIHETGKCKQQVKMAKQQKHQTVSDWKRVSQMDYFRFEVLRPRERTCMRERATNQPLNQWTSQSIHQLNDICMWVISLLILFSPFLCCTAWPLWLHSTLTMKWETESFSGPSVHQTHPHTH